jgi:hypothetical protein
MSQLGLWRLGPVNGRHRHTNQYLGQIEVPVLKALAASRWRLEGSDPSAMARDMNTAPDFIRDQKIGSFATFVRGETPTAISMHFPLNALSRFERMTAEERRIVRQRNRDAYSNRLEPATDLIPA